MFSLNNKSVKNQIEELKSLVAEGKIVPTAGVDYNSVRAKFNLLTMSILIGSGLEEKEKDEWTSTGWSKLPNKDQLRTVMLLINDYITNVEPRFINEQTPAKVAAGAPGGLIVPVVDDINNEKFRDIIGKAIKQRMTQGDFLRLSDLAERLRRHNLKVAGFWAAGIVIAIAAGVGVYIYNKNKNEKEAAAEDDQAEYDDVGSDVVITVEDDDTPIVIITDDNDISVG